MLPGKTAWTLLRLLLIDRATLIAENLALRQQLAVALRSGRREGFDDCRAAEAVLGWLVPEMPPFARAPRPTTRGYRCDGRARIGAKRISRACTCGPFIHGSREAVFLGSGSHEQVELRAAVGRPGMSVTRLEA